MGGHICKYISDKELLSRIYKNSYKLKNNKNKQPNLKMDKVLE